MVDGVVVALRVCGVLLPEEARLFCEVGRARDYNESVGGRDAMLKLRNDLDNAWDNLDPVHIAGYDAVPRDLKSVFLDVYVVHIPILSKYLKSPLNELNSAVERLSSRVNWCVFCNTIDTTMHRLERIMNSIRPDIEANAKDRLRIIQAELADVQLQVFMLRTTCRACASLKLLRDN